MALRRPKTGNRKRPAWRNSAYWLALIVTGGLAVRIAAVLAANDVLLLDEVLYVRGARAIAAGSTGWDPLFAPPYPGFLAATFSLFGPSLLPPRLAQAFLGTFAIVLTYALSARLHGRGAGLAAAAFVAFLPEVAGFAALVYSEHLFLPLGVGSLVTLLAAMDRPERLERFAFAGLLLGLATLTREVALAFAPIAAAIAAAGPGPGRLRRCAAVLLPVTLIAGAWMSANAARHGTFALTANRWKPILEGNGTHEDLAEFLAAFDRDRFEAETFARERSLERIAEAQPLWIVRKPKAAFEGLFEPKTFLYRQILRAGGERWAAAALFVVEAPLFLLLLLGAAFGFLSMRWDRRTVLLLSFMAMLFSIHVLSLAVSRHRLPFIPILAVGAGAFYHHLWHDRDSLRPLLRPARIAAAATAAIAVALAWTSFFTERW